MRTNSNYSICLQACSKKLQKGKVALMVVMLKTIERVGMNASAILEDSTGIVIKSSRSLGLFAYTFFLC